VFTKERINYTLYLVTDRDLLGKRDLATSIAEAIAGGVTMIQLREKKCTTREFYNLAVKTKAVAASYKIPFIVNDRLDIALAVDADGLHVGTDDLPVSVARNLLGPDKILGVSAANLAEAQAAQAQGADYLGVGAIFPTATKEVTHSVSLTDLRLIKSSVQIPIVAIGGINETNAKEVMQTGIDGIAVVSAILSKPDICAAAQKLYSIIV
jgi:thiamine-phosphate pyrophosphorylase